MIAPDDPRHGTNAGYWQGCRETCCRDAHADYKRSLRAKRYINRTDRLYIPAVGTTRRLHALIALGWRWEDMEARVNLGPRGRSELSKIPHRTRVHLDTARRVATLYDALCMTPGPSERNRKVARAWGYLPPLAWDDIDDPNERPQVGNDDRSKDDYDEAVVLRVMAGERLTMTRAERCEVVLRLRDGRGWSEERIYEHTGITQASDVGRFPRKEGAA